MKRSRVLGAALASILLIGCEGEAPNLELLPEGDPAVLEPGYVTLPPPASPPAIEIVSSGGIDGGGTGDLQIWEDGTVMFGGTGCPNWSHRRGKLSPERIRAVIDKLEAAQFFMWPYNGQGGCPDSFRTSITVRRGRAANTLVDKGCRSQETFAARAIEVVRKAVGKNACSPSCRGTRAPAYCR